MLDREGNPTLASLRHFVCTLQSELLSLEIIVNLTNSAKHAMSYLVRRHKEVIIVTLSLKGAFFVRLEDRACCIFYPPAQSEIEEGVSVIHPVKKYLDQRMNLTLKISKISNL